MKLNSDRIITDVLPEQSIFVKAYHGQFLFYLSEIDLINKSSFAVQYPSESFMDFCIRVVEQLIEYEKENPGCYPVVTMDYAVNKRLIEE